MSENLVIDKQWYILWMGSYDDRKLPEIMAGFDAQLWTPAYSKTLTDGTVEQTPMYPTYHFVFCSPDTTREIESRCEELKYTASKFLRDDVSRNPLRVMEDEVTEIRELEKSFLETEEFFLDEEVIISQGPFQDYKGIVREVQKVYLKVEFLFFGTESRTLSIKKAHCQKIV